jgi:hypothetical protein
LVEACWSLVYTSTICLLYHDEAHEIRDGLNALTVTDGVEGQLEVPLMILISNRAAGVAENLASWLGVSTEKFIPGLLAGYACTSFIKLAGQLARRRLAELAAVPDEE